MSKPRTQAQKDKRKIREQAQRRAEQLRRMHRTFPQWHEGMPVKEYARRYRMANLEAAVFLSKELYFLGE
jgi:methylphosphotriester-DNA--protein-cysteine methyltransferase